MTRFIVTGRIAAFPIDMLRWDRCFPLTKEDSSTIISTFGNRSGRGKRWYVELVSVDDDPPSEEIWAKHGVQILQMNTNSNKESSHDGRNDKEN